MKKKIVFITAVVILAVSFGLFAYKTFVAGLFRYTTPTEAFFHSCPRGSELIDIIEDQDVALVIYKNKEGSYSDRILAKDARGWTPLSVNYKKWKQVQQDNGFVYLKEVQGKNVVQIVLVIKAGEEAPVISDSQGSAFFSGTYPLEDGGKILYGFLVLGEKVPDDYRVKLGDQEVLCG